MRTARIRAAVLTTPIVVGTFGILVLAITVYVSYVAENGLPFTPTYDINVQVANADELAKNADVRIGGVRVGQVLTLTAERPSRTWPHPYARLGLALSRNLEPLPADTHYRIRLASILGGKYLELIPGSRRGGAGGVPDGGTLMLSAHPRLSHELPFVDLDTALGTFGPATQAGLRQATGAYAEVLAGRGAQLNDVFFSVARLLGPLDDVLRILGDPRSRLSALVAGAAQTSGALATVAPRLTSLLANGATTFGALERSAIGHAIDQLPATESVASTELTRSLPALGEAAQISSELRPAAARLPAAADGLDRVVRAATPVFGPVPTLASRLRAALAAVQSLSRDPVSIQTLRALGSKDLATLGSSVFVGLGAILRAIAPAQLACNVAGLWVRNFASAISEGDSTGSWLRTLPLVDQNEPSATATPSSDLHLNPYPVEGASQCQAGNEGYSGRQLIGSPPRTSTTVDNTTPPPAVLERGEKAGLVP